MSWQFWRWLRHFGTVLTSEQEYRISSSWHLSFEVRRTSQLGPLSSYMEVNIPGIYFKFRFSWSSGQWTSSLSRHTYNLLIALYSKMWCPSGHCSNQGAVDHVVCDSRYVREISAISATLFPLLTLGESWYARTTCTASSSNNMVTSPPSRIEVKRWGRGCNWPQ